MDQNNQQDNSIQRQAQVQTPPVQPSVSAQSVQGQSQAQPISAPQKEILQPVSQPHQEWIQPSDKTPELNKEIAEAGVESVPEMPKLSEEHKQAGISFAKESTPVSTAPSGEVQLPLTKQQATNILGLHKKITNSITWLAVLVLKKLKMKEDKIN